MPMKPFPVRASARFRIQEPFMMTQILKKDKIWNSFLEDW